MIERRRMPPLPSTPKPAALHRMRRFVVTHDNSSVHGRYPIQTKVSEGCIFTSGHVMLDTDLKQKGFVSMGELEEVLGRWGNVSIEWVDAD